MDLRMAYRWWCVAALALLLAAANTPGAEPRRRVALLPPVPLNRAADAKAALQNLSQRLFDDLVAYPQIELVPQKMVGEAMRDERLLSGRIDKMSATRIAKRLKADLLFLPSLAQFTTAASTEEFLNLWLVDGRTGLVVAAADEEADEMVAASSLIYSVQGERFEQMIATAIAHVSDQPAAGARAVGVLPFEESTDDTQGRALAGMVATRWMRRTSDRVVLGSRPLSREQLPRDEALASLAKAGARVALEGRITQPEGEGLPTVEFHLTDVRTRERSRTYRLTLPGDTALRRTAAEIALHLSPGGEHILWLRSVGAGTAPSLVGGRLVYGCEERRIDCLSALTGEQLWQQELSPLVGLPKQVAGSGKSVYAQCGARILRLDSETGKVLDQIVGSPPTTWPHTGLLLTPKRVVYATADQRLLAFPRESPDGRPITEADWSAKGHGSFQSGPAYGEGLVFVGCDDHQLYAFDAQTGKPRWRFRADGRVRSTPHVADGLVSFGTETGSYVALDTREGKKLWETSLPDSIVAEAASIGDALIVGGCGGAVSCIGKEKGNVRWQAQLDGAIVARPALESRSALLATKKGNVYAVGMAEGSVRELLRIGHPVLTQPAAASPDALMKEAMDFSSEAVEGYETILFVTTTKGYVIALGVRDP